MSTNFLGGGVVLDEAGRPLDQIVLTGITATGYHGVFEHERREGQTFGADVVVHLDTRRAAAGDDLTRTVNYGVLAEAVAGVLAGDPADLLETVAERIAATALADPAVFAVDVAVHKPQAPITVPFEDVVVRVHRDRHKLPAAEPWRRPDATRTAGRRAEAADSDGAAGRSATPVPVPEPQPVVATSDSVASASASAPGGADARPAPAVEHPDRLDQAPPAPVEAVLALGGNLGAAQSTLREAVADIERIAGVEILAVSPLARTAAVGGPGQPDFLNAVVIVRTALSPRALLHAVQAIEQQHGRERHERWGPRTLDIDLITYGSTLAVTDDLELPHPRAHERAFVLEPWAQVVPDAVLPGLGGGPVAVLAATAPDRDGVRWMALDWMTAALPSGPRDHEAAVLDGPAAPDGGHHAAPAAVSGDHRLAPAAHGHVAPGPDPRPAAPAPEPVRGPLVEPGSAGGVDGAAPGPAVAHGATALAPDGVEPQEPAGAEDDPTEADPGASRAPDGPLDWLPALPTPGTANASAEGGAGGRTPIFSPVVAPDDVPHPGDRQS